MRNDWLGLALRGWQGAGFGARLSVGLEEPNDPAVPALNLLQAGGEGYAPNTTTAAFSVDESLARWSGTPALNVDITSGTLANAAGALIVVAVGGDTPANASMTASVSDSGGLSWTQQVSRNTNGNDDGGHVSIWTAFAAAAGSRTISVRRTAGQDGAQLTAKAYAINGEAASPIGATGSGLDLSANVLNPTALTVTAPFSLIVASAVDWNALGNPTSSDLNEDAFTLGAALSGLAGWEDGPREGAVVLNLDAAGAGVASWKWAAIEIKRGFVARSVARTRAHL